VVAILTTVGGSFSPSGRLAASKRRSSGATQLNLACGEKAMKLESSLQEGDEGESPA
jgi:hypothetical protein